MAVFPPKTVIGHFSTVAVALGGLTIWHAVLISRGETSIERHLNNKETKRMRKCGKVHAHTHTHTPCLTVGEHKLFKLFSYSSQVYKNSFNYGRLNNWKVFLGVEKKRLVRCFSSPGCVTI